ncbi:MAG: polyketide cyclase [Alphaproteobacteria bacterium]|nr:MAG: polyketide cyclase [Alphaproteobacteria bacterium]
MLNDIEHHLGAVERRVVSLERDGAPARAVILRRIYKTTIDDLWNAVTNKERLPRWFARVEGELKIGGHYQVENNAGGEIVQCDPPNMFSLSWVFGEDVSWVDVELKAESSDTACLTLMHTARLSPLWDQFGPGAVGVGWELGLLGLALHLADSKAEKLDEETFAASVEGKAFGRGSSAKWGAAAISAGEDPDKALASASRVAAFYTDETEVG